MQIFSRSPLIAHRKKKKKKEGKRKKRKTVEIGVVNFRAGEQ